LVFDPFAAKEVAMVRVVDSGKEVVWRQRLRRFRKSGLTVIAFCRSEGVSAPSFYHWRKRLTQRTGRRRSAAKRPRESFVPVRLTAPLAQVGAEPPVEILLPNGVQVRVPGGDLAVLRAGIEAAGAIPSATVAAAPRARIEEDLRC
jgi:transposase